MGEKWVKVMGGEEKLQGGESKVNKVNRSGYI